MYHLFYNRNTTIIALTDSSFFHLGTIGELFDSYLNETHPESIEFRTSLGFKPFKIANAHANFLNLNGVVMDSRIGLKCKLSKQSIVEYCFFDDQVEIELGEFSYLSNCAIKSEELAQKSYHFRIPNDVCMHTIPVRNSKNENKFVTIFFDRHDDLKKEYETVRLVKFLSVSDGFLDEVGLVELTNLNSNSIWNIKVFKAYDTMSESFARSLEFLIHFKSSNNQERKIFLSEYFRRLSELKNEFYSLFDILKVNNFEKMIEFRINHSLI